MEPHVFVRTLATLFQSQQIIPKKMLPQHKVCTTEGTLLKKSVWLKRWNRRYFRLRGRTLCYYENENSRVARGEIPLIEAKVGPVELVGQNAGPTPFTIVVSTAKNEEHLLCAASDQERDHWLKHMAIAIERGPMANVKVAKKEEMNQQGQEQEEEEETLAKLEPVPPPPPPPPDATDPLSYLMDMTMTITPMKKDKKTTTSPTTTQRNQKPQVQQVEHQPKQEKQEQSLSQHEQPKQQQQNLFLGGTSEKVEAKPEQVNGLGLRNAVKKGDLQLVRDILEKDPSLCRFTDTQQQTVLHLAAMFKHQDIAVCLVQAGADPTIKNKEGESVLDIAPLSMSKLLKTEFEAKQ